MTTTDPTASTYAETWAGRGVPMDELAAFVARAVDAGAPLTARIRLEDVDRNVLFGLTAPGTRMSVTWSFAPRPAAPIPRAGAYDEVEQVIALEDARYRQEGTRNRQERPKGGIIDPKRLALIHDVPVDMVDVKTHADPPPPDDAVELGTADPWPFKPGDVVDDAEGAITEQLDAAPVGTTVTDDIDPDVPWKYEGRSSWVGTYRTTSDALASHGILTVVSVGKGD